MAVQPQLVRLELHRGYPRLARRFRTRDSPTNQGARGARESLAEARENPVEAVALAMEANRALAEESLQGKDVIREPLVVA